MSTAEKRVRPASDLGASATGGRGDQAGSASPAAAPDQDLFRREVYQARKGDWLGSVQLSAVRLGWPMAMLASLIVVTVVVALVFGGHARKVQVSGRLVPVGGVVDVVASASGVVTRRLVSEGEVVIAGQALVEISPDVDLADGGAAVAERIAAELQQRQARLRQTLEQLDLAESQQTSVLRGRILSLQQQLDSVDVELELRRQQADAAEGMLERIRPLREQRALSDIQVQQYEDQALNTRAMVESARRNRLDTADALDQLRHELDALPRTLMARRSELEGALGEIAQSLARSMAQHAVLLKAPAPGMVSAVAVGEGQPVGERQRLLSILPERATLQAELWAPSRAIGSIAMGSEVTLRFHAFPYQTFGHQLGRIVEIAASPLSAAEVRERTGIDPGASAYRVVVELHSAGNPQRRPLPALRAGMALDADLIQEQRRLYQWLIAPMGGENAGAPSASATTGDVQ